MIPVRLGLVSPAPIPDACVDELRAELGDLTPVAVELPEPGAFHAAAYAIRPHTTHDATHPDATHPDAPGHPQAPRVRALAAAHGVDAALTCGPLAARPPRLLVMDVDSTLVTAEVIELIAERAGTRAEVAAVTERAMRGELDFAASLRERVATLAGVPATVFDEVRAELALSPGARALVARVHAAGGRVGLVSGGFAEVVVPVAADLGIPADLVRANRLEVADGRLTGRTLGPVVDRAAKALHLADYAQRLGVTPAETVAVGDGANDLDMLATAGLGVAYCAKPVTRDAADAAVSFPRLDAVWAFVAGS